MLVAVKTADLMDAVGLADSRAANPPAWSSEKVKFNLFEMDVNKK